MRNGSWPSGRAPRSGGGTTISPRVWPTRFLVLLSEGPPQLRAGPGFSHCRTGPGGSRHLACTGAATARSSRPTPGRSTRAPGRASRCGVRLRRDDGRGALPLHGHERRPRARSRVTGAARCGNEGQAFFGASERSCRLRRPAPSPFFLVASQRSAADDALCRRDLAGEVHQIWWLAVPERPHSLLP